jgi:hypothetical protein
MMRYQKQAVLKTSMKAHNAKVAPATWREYSEICFQEPW